MTKRNYHIAIVSCCIDDWGGSEELWARAIPLLKEANCSFTLYKNKFNLQHPEIKKLSSFGVKLIELDPKKSSYQRIKNKVKAIKRRLANYYHPNPITIDKTAEAFYKQLKQDKPDLAVVAQGINFDGMFYAYECKVLNIPYVIISQKAVEFFWPPGNDRTVMKELFVAAKKCYFVSRQNQRLTEEQFGFRFNNAEQVSNPIKIASATVPFPSDTATYKLACVGRLFIIDKGQDILLRILSKEPWKSRNIEVSFVGSGVDEKGLIEMADLLGVSNVKFLGHVKNIEEIWRTHHALLQPSRSEGMALSVLEAMAAGRTVVVTNAGGHAELVEDTVNGFISEATEAAFEANMEQAWKARDNWQFIGKKATETVSHLIKEVPEKKFSTSIMNLLNEL